VAASGKFQKEDSRHSAGRKQLDRYLTNAEESRILEVLTTTLAGHMIITKLLAKLLTVNTLKHHQPLVFAARQRYNAA
jgi:hypothetical protein